MKTGQVYLVQSFSSLTGRFSIHLDTSPLILFFSKARGLGNGSLCVLSAVIAFHYRYPTGLTSSLAAGLIHHPPTTFFQCYVYSRVHRSKTVYRMGTKLRILIFVKVCLHFNRAVLDSKCIFSNVFRYHLLQHS